MIQPIQDFLKSMENPDGKVSGYPVYLQSSDRGLVPAKFLWFEGENIEIDCEGRLMVITPQHFNRLRLIDIPTTSNMN